MNSFNVERFAKYAIAAYNWPVLMTALDPCCFCCRIFPKLKCCGCCGCFRSRCCSRGSDSDDDFIHRLEEADFTNLDRPVVIEDYGCGCNVAGLKAMLKGVPGVRLALCYFDNDLYFSPFFIAVDEEAKSIVIAIRGSLSFADAICDVVMTTTPLFPHHRGTAPATTEAPETAEAPAMTADATTAEAASFVKDNATEITTKENTENKGRIHN